MYWSKWQEYSFFLAKINVNRECNKNIVGPYIVPRYPALNI